MLLTKTQSNSRNYQCQLKSKCLKQNGNKYQITGYYDRNITKKLPPLELAGLLKIYSLFIVLDVSNN